jgi:hypothetical protein
MGAARQGVNTLFLNPEIAIQDSPEGRIERLVAGIYLSCGRDGRHD